ncbi:MAG TPA: hypothetical protein VMW27_19335 [Thermoanaerobaculia bacterium]|nr:hypothetical protein [Thermoanaerobaculia bacterium]
MRWRASCAAARLLESVERKTAERWEEDLPGKDRTRVALAGLPSSARWTTSGD